MVVMVVAVTCDFEFDTDDTALERVGSLFQNGTKTNNIFDLIGFVFIPAQESQSRHKERIWQKDGDYDIWGDSVNDLDDGDSLQEWESARVWLKPSAGWSAQSLSQTEKISVRFPFEPLFKVSLLRIQSFILFIESIAWAILSSVTLLPSPPMSLSPELPVCQKFAFKYETMLCST